MSTTRIQSDYGSEDFNPFNNNDYDDELEEGDANYELDDEGQDDDLYNEEDDDLELDDLDELDNNEDDKDTIYELDYLDSSYSNDNENDEEYYDGLDDGGNFDDINMFQDEVLEEKNPDELKAFLASNGEGDYEYDEEDEHLQEQVEYNRYLLRDSEIAEDVSLIDDPDDTYNKPSKFSEETIRYANMFRIILIFAIGLFITAMIVSLISTKNSEKDIAAENYISPPHNNPAGNGQIYNPSDNQNDSSVPTSNIEEDNNSNSSEDNVDVPENGSLVKYEISTQGDISEVALSYIDEEGNAQSNTNVSLPWSTTIGMEQGYSPVLKANSSGTGTVTCTITSDGQVISRDTRSGDNPTVSCELSSDISTTQ